MSQLAKNGHFNNFPHSDLSFLLRMTLFSVSESKWFTKYRIHIHIAHFYHNKYFLKKNKTYNLLCEFSIERQDEDKFL